MNSYTTEALNPTAFISAAYGTVAMLVIGYSAFLIWHRRRIKQVNRIIASGG